VSDIKIPKMFYESGVFVDDERGLPILNPKYRIFCIKGGRGGGKSHTICGVLIIMAIAHQIRVLCAREIQNSLDDSVLRLLSDKVTEYGLEDHYTIQKNTLKSANGSEFLFKGLLRNIKSVKSGEGYDICFVEESETVSQESIDVLIPTIRKQGSQLIFAWNPERDDAPVESLTDRPDCLTMHINYNDNPFCPDELVREAELCKRMRPDKYDWIWLGQHREETDAQVFKGRYCIDLFEKPDGVKPYFGLDFGFNPDPFAFVRCFVHNEYNGKQGNYLFIDYDVAEINVLPTQIYNRIKDIPEIHNHEIRADSSRNDSIAIVQQDLPWTVGAKKGKGSVETGIEFLLSFDMIVIHRRCKATIEEFKLYSYETDRVTGKIIRKLSDKHNHCIDSLRYSLESLWNNSQIKTVDIRGILR